MEWKFKKLQQIIASYPNLLVAYSGGVDSTFLLKTSADVLGRKVLGVIGDSPSLARRELSDALKVARTFDLPVLALKTNELENENYRRNPDNRCYHCKKELFSELFEYAKAHGFRVIADGTNADDASENRPGMKAAGELDVRSPLREAGLSKAEIRELSRRMGLPTWNKPELACLSSRFPTGISINREKLTRVEQAEEFLWGLGFSQLRVRHHENLARIEIDPAEFPLLVQETIRQKVVEQFKKLGYTHITMDLMGYKRQTTQSEHDIVTKIK